MVLGTVFSFSSCSSEDDEVGLVGWYVNKNWLATANDFNEINKAIEQGEILSQYKYSGTTHTYFAARDLFFYSDGRYHDSDAYFGRLRFSVDSFINVYRIIDGNTMIFYIGDLYELNATGAQGKERLYTFDAGHIFGKMAYYATYSSYISYVKKENKIITSDGDIFTITASGIVQDGSSVVLTKYTPN